eukprot:gene7712-biopygen33
MLQPRFLPKRWGGGGYHARDKGRVGAVNVSASCRRCSAGRGGPFSRPTGIVRVGRPRPPRRRGRRRAHALEHTVTALSLPRSRGSGNTRWARDRVQATKYNM